MSIQVHIPVNKFDIAVDLARNTTIILGFLNEVNVFLACSKIVHYGHFWHRRHKSFPITQLSSQLKFLHRGQNSDLKLSIGMRKVGDDGTWYQ